MVEKKEYQFAVGGLGNISLKKERKRKKKKRKREGIGGGKQDFILCATAHLEN